MAFEEEFGSEISDSEAENFTVGDATKFIEKSKLKSYNFLMTRDENIMIILSHPQELVKQL